VLFPYRNGWQPARSIGGSKFFPNEGIGTSLWELIHLANYPPFWRVIDIGIQEKISSYLFICNHPEFQNTFHQPLRQNKTLKKADLLLTPPPRDFSGHLSVKEPRPLFLQRPN
jgi:hypothetical protein